MGMKDMGMKDLKKKNESMTLLFTTIFMEKNANRKTRNHTHFTFRYTAGVACDWYQIVLNHKFFYHIGFKFDSNITTFC